MDPEFTAGASPAPPAAVSPLGRLLRDLELTARAEEAIQRLIRERGLAVQDWTEYQFACALKQAIESGDFVHYITTDGRQQVVYEPYQEAERLRTEVEELQARIKVLEEGLLEALTMAKRWP